MHRDSLLVSASLLATSLGGAAVSALLVILAGSGAATDAVVAAYSLYLVFALVAATARSALVPLFGSNSDPRFLTTVRDVGGRTILVGLALVALGLAAAPVLGPIVTGGLPASAQATSAEALAMLAPSVGLQVDAATASAALTAAGRIATSAAGYAGGAMVTVAAAVPAIAGLGVLGLPVAVLAGSIALAGLHRAALGRHGVRFDASLRRLLQRGQWRHAWYLASTAALPLAWQAQLAICLAGIDAAPGQLTAYAYAYFLVAAALTVTATAGSLVALPRIVAEVSRGGRSAAADLLVRVVPLSIAAAAPLLVIGAAFGEPVLHLLLDPSLGASTVRTLQRVLEVLVVLGLANAVGVIAWPIAIALGRERAVLWISALIVLAQLGAVLVVSGDPRVVAASQAVVAVFGACALLVAALGGSAWATARRIAVRAAPVGLLLAPVVLLRELVGTPPAVAAAAIGCAALAAYAVVGVRLWPGLFSGLPLVGRLAPRTAA